MVVHGRVIVDRDSARIVGVSVSASSPEGDPVGPVVAIGEAVLANPGFAS